MKAIAPEAGAGDAFPKPFEQPMRVAFAPSAHSWISRTSRISQCRPTRPVRTRAALGLFLLALVPSMVLAESADREKPTNVESDRMHYDERKQTTVFTGRVILTKGTLIIRGDELTLRQDSNNQQLATAIGKPATFRQKRDGPGEQYVNGTGTTIDYDSRTEKLVLTGTAVMSRSECGRTMDQVTGAQIIYDGQTETFTVDGKRATGQPARSPTGRVRLTIQPRPDGKSDSKADHKGSSQTAQPCPPGEAIKLQPDVGGAVPRSDAPDLSRR